jgi:hypothetical protein
MTKYPNTQSRKKPETQMTNHRPEINDEGREKPYDLEERTALFGEARVLWQEAKELHLIFAKIYRG